MVIPEDILFQQNAVVRTYSKNETIFSKGSCMKNYFQIQEGIVKVSSTPDDGKEFVHGFPFKGHCFGESYLFTEKPYAITATALTSCNIISLTKYEYLNLIEIKPQILLDVYQYTAERLHFRYMVSSFLSITDSMLKMQMLLDHLKNYFEYTEKYSFEVPYTRSQLAGLTGLRVETVIRVLKKMEKLKLLKIEHSKIYC